MTAIPPPAGTELEDLELFAAQVNRAFRAIPDRAYAIIGGQEVELGDVDTAINAIVRTQQHDELQGVDVSVAHLLFLLLDGTRPMTGDLDMATHALMFRGSTAVQLRSQAAGYANLEATTQIYFDINTGHKMYLNSTHFVLDDVDVDMVGHHIDNIEWLKWDTAALTGGLGVAVVGPVGTVFGIIDGGGGDMPVGQFTGDGSDGIHIGGLTLGYGGNILTVAMNGADAELDLDTAATIKFLKDTLNPASTKHYFDAGAAAGGEWIESPADTIGRMVAAAYWQVGTGTPTHLAGTANSFHVSGKSEFDGETFFDGITRHYGLAQFLGETRHNAAVNYQLNDATRASITFQGTGAGNVSRMSFDDTINQGWVALRDTIGRQFIFTDWGNRVKDHGHADLGYPAAYVHGVADPTAAGATHWWRVAFDGTDGVYTVGSGVHKFIGGGMSFSSGMQVEQATISAAATLTAAHYIVLCDTDTAGAAFTVTLPAAALHAGRVYKIVNEGTNDYDVTVDGNGAEEINHETTQIVGDSQAMAIVCDGTAWWVI